MPAFVPLWPGRAENLEKGIRLDTSQYAFRHPIGRALVDYIRHSRPQSTSRNIFLRHVAPVGIAGTATMIRGIVTRAFGRAGLSDIHTGMHSFRHTAATQMRRHGEELKAIADVIGHRSIQTTLLYAQIDTPALQAVAQPWPEEVQ